MFDELLQSLGQALENKFGKVINRYIKRITATHRTSEAFEGNCHVLLPYSRQKRKSQKHTKMECFLDVASFANPFYLQRETGHLPS